MNKAARKHLLGCMERRASPLYVVKLAKPRESHWEAPDERVSGLNARWNIVLPAEQEITFIEPKNAARAIAGKSGRRRGIRDRWPALTMWMENRINLRDASPPGA